ncbi:hypothetical protein CDO26_05730 [Sinorhizobium meliloti]|uniref:hypothetical protein n=1 Tax=Rhizobium meliloti TaxID=382 RepID=UPI000B49BB39|nr:hypothetical protein [Sinorhizobium meliloti]ASP84152.1 hypothetical protein CDO26_05730 [Sinorhizobium meliloti]MQW28414.1 hypothetical protein [Sinorhizobium meliloti]
MSAPVVRAKFRCMSITHSFSTSRDYSAATVTLVPVWEQEGVNKGWSKTTPSGEIKMLITNPGAVDQFDLGKEYFIDFTPAY